MDGASAATNLFEEETEAQIGNTRKCIQLGDKFPTDLAIARIAHNLPYRWLMKQLARAGSAWETRQQQKMLDTGHREYRVLVAHDGEDTMDLFASLARTLVDPDEWLLLQRRTEQEQLQAFLTLSHCACAATLLVYDRNNNWPYRAFHALREPAMYEVINNNPPCQLDTFMENFQEFYGSDIGSDMCKSELELLLAMSEDNTVSTERAHSVNSQMARGRRLTHRLDLATLDAYYIGKSFRAGKEEKEQTEDKPQPAQKRERANSKLSKRRSSGGGAWRAFVHIQAAGLKCEGATFSELSATFKALTDEEREYYEELGALAADLHKARGHAFTKRRRRAKAQPHGDDGEAAAGGVHDPTRGD